MNNISPSKYLKNAHSFYDSVQSLAPCKTCGNLKERGKKCAECRKYKSEFTLKVQKTAMGQPRIVEIYAPVTTKKSQPININREIYRPFKIGNFRNTKGQWLNMHTDPKNPYEIFVGTRGGEHKMWFKLSIYDILEMVKNWRAGYEDVFGERPRLMRLPTIKKMLKKMEMKSTLQLLRKYKFDRGRKKDIF